MEPNRPIFAFAPWAIILWFWELSLRAHNLSLEWSFSKLKHAFCSSKKALSHGVFRLVIFWLVKIFHFCSVLWLLVRMIFCCRVSPVSTSYDTPPDSTHSDSVDLSSVSGSNLVKDSYPSSPDTVTKAHSRHLSDGGWSVREGQCGNTLIARKICVVILKYANICKLHVVLNDQWIRKAYRIAGNFRWLG